MVDICNNKSKKKLRFLRKIQGITERYGIRNNSSGRIEDNIDTKSNRRRTIELGKKSTQDKDNEYFIKASQTTRKEYEQEEMNKSDK